MIETILFYVAMSALGFIAIFLPVAIIREIVLALRGKSDLWNRNR